jgi:membrane protease subunit HflC
MNIKGAVIILVVVILAFVLKAVVYIIPEGQQAVITQFGRPVRAVTEAGPYLKMPFIQQVNRLEKRLLPWDGDPQDMPTKDKRRISIEVWARWRIVVPLRFFKAVGSIDSGQQRLDELVDSAVRAMVAKNDLIDVVRTTDSPLEYESEELEQDWASRRERVTTGRRHIEQEIKRVASVDLEETYGMELVDVRIKRINYVQSVREKVYERMSSERMRIASLYESEAEEQKNRILGQTKKELDEIEGEMMQKSAETRGQADAAVIEITARAFGQSPEFYRFVRQLEAYKSTLTSGTQLILSTENEFLHQLQGADRAAAD